MTSSTESRPVALKVLGVKVSSLVGVAAAVVVIVDSRRVSSVKTRRIQRLYMMLCTVAEPRR